MKAIISFFDRQYNLLFHRKNCIKLNLRPQSWIKYSDTLTNETHKFRCLDKGWYLMKTKKK